MLNKYFKKTLQQFKKKWYYNNNTQFQNTYKEFLHLKMKISVKEIAF